MMFIPATSPRLPLAAARARSTPAPWESSSAEAAVAPVPSSCLRVRPSLRSSDSLIYLCLRKTSTALLAKEVA